MCVAAESGRLRPRKKILFRYTGITGSYTVAFALFAFHLKGCASPPRDIVIVRARGKPHQIGAAWAPRAGDRVVDGKKYDSALLCEQLDSAKQRQSDDIAVFDMTNSLVAQRFVIISEQRFFEVLPEDSRMAVLTV